MREKGKSRAWVRRYCRTTSNVKYAGEAGQLASRTHGSGQCGGTLAEDQSHSHQYFPNHNKFLTQLFQHGLSRVLQIVVANTDHSQSSESRLYVFSPETTAKLRKFRLGTSRAKDPQAVICTILIVLQRMRS
jgi:hypothetical protein